MRNTNLLLIRLNRAVDCSNSKYLSEKALSIILFNNLKNEQVFDNYIEIETRIYDLYQDSYDAMCYLDGYIQYLVDQYRGK